MTDPTIDAPGDRKEEMTPARFPILRSHEERRECPDYPRSVPWSFIAPHAKQAWRNHGQTLERLAQRGGLDPSEMVAVVTGVRWGDIKRGKEAFTAYMELLLELLADPEGRVDQ